MTADGTFSQMWAKFHSNSRTKVLDMMMMMIMMMIVIIIIIIIIY